MKIVIANDHGAVDLAAKLANHLQQRGFEVHHLGVFTEESVDYPDMARKATDEFRKGGYDYGVVCCGTGIGISISANKVNGIRCALPQNIYAAEKAKQHNHCNFIAFGGRVDYRDDPIRMLDAFLDAREEGGRHERRVEKIMALERRE